MSEEELKSMKDNVLSAITQGHVAMRPKWYFMLRASLLIAGTVLLFLAVLYIASFIIFMLHQTGAWFAPGFGTRGVRELLIGLPWLLIVLCAVCIIILHVLVKHFSFSYGKPLLYTAVAIVGLVIIGGLVIAHTSVHKGLMRQAQQHNLPVAGDLYRQYGIHGSQEHIVPGEIAEITATGYILTTPRSESLMIVVTPSTRFPYGADFVLGDRVVVIGDRNGNIITAFGIREVNEEFIPHRPNNPPPPGIPFR